MTLPARDIPPPFTRSPHLVGVIAEAERLAALVSGADAERRAALAEELTAEAAVASLRLDGSPVEVSPEDSGGGTDPRAEAVAATGEATWADTLRSGRAGGPSGEGATGEDRELRALEYLGVTAALHSDDLAEQLLHEPVAALRRLHRRLTRGLVDEADVGRPRRTSQAVHDASVGRVIYFAPDPAEVTSQLNLLGGWVASTGAREHAIVLSGILHYELLRLHPFEAASGRLARAAARLALRARGLDPGGLAAAEIALAEDPLGTYEEVARTMRRRDCTIWLERWGEAVASGLRLAARRLEVVHPTVPDRARRFLSDRDGPRFTIADYRADAAVGPEDARADLHALLDAARVRRIPGSRGLRYEIAAEEAAVTTRS